MSKTQGWVLYIGTILFIILLVGLPAHLKKVSNRERIQMPDRIIPVDPHQSIRGDPHKQAVESRKIAMADRTPATVQITANKQTGSYKLSHLDSLHIELWAPDAESCEMTSPVHSGITTDMHMTLTLANKVMYPTRAKPILFKITCRDKFGHIATDSLVVSSRS